MEDCGFNTHNLILYIQNVLLGYIEGLFRLQAKNIFSEIASVIQRNLHESNIF